MSNIEQTIISESNVSINLTFYPSGKQWAPNKNPADNLMESGQMMINFLVERIETANKMICFSSFIFQDGEIINAISRAIERGVKVFFLCSTTHLRQQQIYDIGEEFVADKFKELLSKKIRNKALLRCANNIHGKFILIDPKSNPKGYLATCNFTEKACKENPELIVALNSEECKELFKIFVWHFWEGTSHEQKSDDNFSKIDATGRFSFPAQKQILLTSTKAGIFSIRDYMKEIIGKAENNIVFSIFGFDLTHKICQLLLKKCKQGVEITVFTRSRSKAIIGHLDKLANAGATVIIHELLHAKFILIDQCVGAVFSANFEKHGLDSGFEVGVKLEQQRIKSLQKIIAHWKQTFPFHLKVKTKVLDLPETYFILGKKSKLEEKKLIPLTESTSKLDAKNLKEIRIAFDKGIKFNERTIKRHSFTLQLSLEEIGKEKLSKIKKLHENIFLGALESETKQQSKKKKSKKKIKQILLLTKDFRFENLKKFNQYEKLSIYMLK